MPLLMAFTGALGLVKVFDLLKGFIGFGGTAAEVTRGGIFVGTVGAITAKAGMSKITSKLRGLQRVIVAFGDDVDSSERGREREREHE